MKKIAIFVVLAISMAGTAFSKSLWTLTATDADSSCYSPPMTGNGQLGTVVDRSGLRAARMFSANAVSRGRESKVSSIVEAICPINLTVNANGSDGPQTEWSQTLDMRIGEVSTSYCLPGLKITNRIVNLRPLPFVTSDVLTVKATADNMKVTVSNTPAVPKSLSASMVSERRFHAGKNEWRFIRAESGFNQQRDVMVATVGMDGDGWDRLSADSMTITLKKGQEATLWIVSSLISSADFTDPWNESERQVLYAVSTGRETLMRRHRAAWNRLWEGDIIIEGDPLLQSHARAALYNLYASAAPGSGRSIAPMGLSSTHYYGHIFWDADTWMLPVMAILQPDIARDMADYRIATLAQARKRAAAYGYSGAMFPWESDDLGEESTPTFALTGPLEHHVTADVAIGAWLCYCSTGDIDWLRDKAWPLLKDCADFWVSRAEKGNDGLYSIKGVVGADEYAIGVNDNAFTNGAVMRSLEYARRAAALLGHKTDPLWEDMEKHMRFHHIPGTEIISEYEGYAGETIKQADVALLAYPLNLLKTPEEIERNLTYYDAKIDSVNGPAMSHSAMAVNYARLGDGEKAARLVARAYQPNLRGAFHNLSESPGNDHVYFVTGAGGLLQSLVFGFAGVEIDTENGGLKQCPSALPKSIESITVKSPHGVFIR
ncbi:MAG: glycoside hydrolase family 65 protein [Paramuribaculum sp.]|nr:glycoside hydrolase family 65 protein [Paramuribaculum sp.]